MKRITSINPIFTQPKQAGIRAFLYALIAIGFTYYFATWLFWKAPTTLLISSIRWWWPLILMWIPGILSILFRIISREGFRDVGWKPGKAIFWLIAISLPLCMAIFTYLVGYLTGIVSIDPNSLHGPMFVDQFGILPGAWPSFTPDSQIVRLLIKFGVVATLGMIPEFIFAFGEELGWRGYLQIRLVQSRLPLPYLICGLVWSLWHLPWLMFQDRVEMLLFILCITLFGVWIGWLRMRSGSVWVAAAAHAAHNAFLLTFFSTSFQTHSPNWVSEAGILPILAYGAIVVILILSGQFKQTTIKTNSGS
jgi:membrane protease YdiL (CAAX protease family)